MGRYTGEYQVGRGKFSKDPLSLVTRQNDAQWTAFVNWVVEATIYAEEKGITQSESSQMPVQFLLGPNYSRVLRDAIQAVGNHAEIYERNMESLVQRGGLNLLNENLSGPQHYPYPGVGEEFTKLWIGIGFHVYFKWIFRVHHLIAKRTTFDYSIATMCLEVTQLSFTGKKRADSGERQPTLLPNKHFCLFWSLGRLYGTRLSFEFPCARAVSIIYGCLPPRRP